jgi:prolyl 4-hydroxylase
MHLRQFSNSVFELLDFLSPAECAELIAGSEQRGYAAAGVATSTGPQLITGIRNNFRQEYADERLAADFWHRIRPFLPAEADGAPAVGLYEQFRFYRYDVGERFNKHKDGRIRLTPDVASRWTLLLYLNEDFTGGETEFENLTVRPQRGTALCFRHELRHKGCAITAGRKYVLRTDILYRGE